MTTERVVMRLEGVNRLEDEAAWGEATTAGHVMLYFNRAAKDLGRGAWDVAASVRVTGQEGGKGTGHDGSRPARDRGTCG